MAWCHIGDGFIKNVELSVNDYGLVQICRCDFDVSKYDQALFDCLGIPLPESIRGSVVKRQAEYLAGRYAAKSVLGNIGVEVNDIPIGQHRSPVWPSGVVASISHSNSTAVCAVSLKSGNCLIGVDIENWLSSKSAQQIKKLVLSDSELEYFQSLPLSLEQSITIAFSAKESLFKAIYPQVNRYLDFDVSIVKEISLVQRRVTIELTAELSSTLGVGTQYHCQLHPDEHQIMTLVSANAE